MQIKVSTGWCRAVIEVTGLRSLAAVLAFLASPAPAQDWPSGTVRVIVPYAAGGPVDVPARLLIDRLTAQTKGTFILENRPGAGGSVGLQSVVQSPPDGSTFLFTTSSVTMVPAIYPKLGFDPLRDLTLDQPDHRDTDQRGGARQSPDPRSRRPDCQGESQSRQVHLRHPAASAPAITWPARLLKKMAGIDLLHVPFRGVAPAMTSLYAGDIDIAFLSTIETVPHARDGRIRVLGVGHAAADAGAAGHAGDRRTSCRAMS